ncbi:hypothetical protein BTVI_78481 [Pitangus sulphuratus]|nr:hypothetical protein BTVI_78481 [Pitangus sulphuratus]
MPASSNTDPLLPKAKKGKKNPAQQHLQLETGVRICEPCRPQGVSPSAQRGLAPAMSTASSTNALYTPVRTPQSRASLNPQGWQQRLTLPGGNGPHGPATFHYYVPWSSEL